MTDEQQSRWRLLSVRERAAQLAGDHDTVQAIQAEKRAVLGVPDPRPARHERDAARSAERERDRVRLRAQWQARPHSRLTNSQLTRAVGDAEQRQTRERAAAEQARRELAEREPAVAAGRGPRVARVDAELDRLRQRAEMQARVEGIQRRWQAVTGRAADAAERAVQRSIEADRTRWWRSGRRERLTAEAADHRAQRDRAQDEAKELARHAADLQQQLGGPRVWRLAREQAERAEARYPDDRHEAQKADEAELTRMHQRVERHGLAAADAGARRDELIAEQQLREVMPQDQRMLETTWRIQATRQDLTRALEHPAAEPEPDLAPTGVEWERDYHERTIDRGIDIDRDGPSLGL